MSTGLGALSASRAHERDDDEKTTLEQAERWATLLSTQLSRVAPQVIVSESPTDWRGGAGELTATGTNDLTGRGASPVQAAGSEDGAASSENRMIVRVDGGDLGEVALVVDRKDGAIRVTIGAADASAQAALGSEREALSRALQSHGISVESVNVVRTNSFGTVLAPPRPNATQRTADESDTASSKDDEQARRRAARKLNLVG